MRNTMLKIAVIVVLAASNNAAQAQTQVYQKLGSWIDPQQEAYSQWETIRRLQASEPRAVAPQSRPQLAGLRPQEVELLEDALLRKFTRRVTSSEIARRYIVRLSKSVNGRNVLNGAMHEALFLQRNPEWGYVLKPNSPQNDVFRFVPGRKTPIGGQLKFFADGDPARYAAEIRKYDSVHRLFVPDDHAGPLKAYLRAKAEMLAASGDPVGAKELWRAYGRVRGSGVTSTEVPTDMRNAARIIERENHSVYISFGASLALAAGPIIWDWANEGMDTDRAIYQLERSFSVLGVGVGTDVLLGRTAEGSLRGGLRGNVIVGTAIFITETAWLLNEHGWEQAAYDPEFYESMGGSVAGIAIGFLATGVFEESVPGPGWVVGTGSILTGAAVGVVGYFGGHTATHWILVHFTPDILRQQERGRLAQAQAHIERRLVDLATLSTP